MPTHIWKKLVHTIEKQIGLALAIGKNEHLGHGGVFVEEMFE
jgi:hypothetical protein